MAKDKISDYSSTANSNTDIAGINIDEGCAPSGINDAIRTLMAQLKTWQSGGQDVYIHPAGSASAPSITANGDTNTGIFFPAADTVGITTGGTERARVDSSGNLGLGVTPSAWGGSFRALQVGAVGSAYVSSAGDVIFGRNTYNNGTNSLYLTSNYASAYGMISGQHQWYTAASGTAGNAITFTQAMTLDAAGSLAIGTTSSLSSLYRITSAGGRVAFTSDSDGLNLYLRYNSSTVGAFVGSPAANVLAFSDSNGTERARIDSSGNLLVGTTSGNVRLVVNGSTGAASFTGDDLNHYQATFNSKSASSSTHYMMGFFKSTGTAVGAITHNDTSTTYATSSDYRLKENIAPMTGALSVVAQLKPCTYTWKSTSEAGQGFIAHELQAVLPDAVVGEKDAVDEDGNPKYQGIDTSFLVATLTAAIQELKAEFDAYKASHP